MCRTTSTFALRERGTRFPLNFRGGFKAQSPCPSLIRAMGGFHSSPLQRFAGYSVIISRNLIHSMRFLRGRSVWGPSILLQSGVPNTRMTGWVEDWSCNMSTLIKKRLVLALTGSFVVAVNLAGPATAQKASVPKLQDKLALGENEVRQLVALMDADRNGKVSKTQYMKFMEAEFERLDKDKKGELDVRELTKSTLAANRWVGK